MKREHAYLALLAVGAGIAVAVAMSRKQNGERVFYRHRATGCHPALILFLDWWEKNGSFPIAVTDGGRTQAEVDRNFAAGTSKATTILETAHGPRLVKGTAYFCAIDVAPAVLDEARARVVSLDYADKAKFATIGRAAKSGFNLEWGGDFPNFYDGPHIQVAGWRSLPVPKASVV